MKVYNTTPGFVTKAENLAQEILEVYAEEYTRRLGKDYNKQKLNNLAKLPTYCTSIKKYLSFYSNKKLEIINSIINPELNNPKYSGDLNYIPPQEQVIELHKIFNLRKYKVK